MAAFAKGGSSGKIQKAVGGVTLFPVLCRTVAEAPPTVF